MISQVGRSQVAPLLLITQQPQDTREWQVPQLPDPEVHLSQGLATHSQFPFTSLAPLLPPTGGHSPSSVLWRGLVASVLGVKFKDPETVS